MSKKVDLRTLDTSNPASWPFAIKIAACTLLGLVIIGVCWYFFVADKRTELEGLEAHEVQLRDEFQGKQGRAANLEPLKQQLAQMELMLQQMLRQLPSKNEMPDLIVDVSQTALASGINNELFQPGAETNKEFYAEKPITLRMVGTYHQFGAFVSGVASLPRVVIMTMHDISLKPRGGANDTLELSGTVKTYRYLDDAEVAEQEAAAKAAAGGAPAAAAPAPAPTPATGGAK
ncbi:MAG TPA: type 4a pilus biogenesis protein PilO [Arenimonas sp.]|uniref:type 4a pilus biogenesis protein PilO n=1 Tax=Arenimonas sp. TaxID=1872635 RepID=UPI002C5D27B2|nr:type 4a pilus biogenesis protein PilO [Arenimonas sp.]HMB57795.1 type 4a pilus biogenesis protein PilO [Arenimonas sp.]